MSTPMQIDNINRVFAVFDVSGNGKISWHDFETLAHRIGGEFGWEPGSTEVGGLIEAYQDLWDYLSGAADLDEDGAVVRAEFGNAHSSQELSAGTLLDKWVVSAERCFDLADQDGDGRIDEDGLAGIYRAGGITDRQIARVAFREMDLDEDNRVDKTEFLAQVRGLFLAVDESMKGAHLISGS